MWTKHSGFFFPAISRAPVQSSPCFVFSWTSILESYPPSWLQGTTLFYTAPYGNKDQWWLELSCGPGKTAEAPSCGALCWSYGPIATSSAYLWSMLLAITSSDAPSWLISYALLYLTVCMCMNMHTVWAHFLMGSSSGCILMQRSSWNHRMAWVGRGLKDREAPTLPCCMQGCQHPYPILDQAAQSWLIVFHVYFWRMHSWIFSSHWAVSGCWCRSVLMMPGDQLVSDKFTSLEPMLSHSKCSL